MLPSLSDALDGVTTAASATRLGARRASPRDERSTPNIPEHPRHTLRRFHDPIRSPGHRIPARPSTWRATQS